MENNVLTGKERRQLKKEIHGQDPKLYIGKNGLTGNVLDQANDLLDKYELIKVKVQRSVDTSKEEIMDEMIEKLGAHYVMDIGLVFAIYRPKADE